MGFMAGFGSAFADSFNRADQNNAQHKEDLFKLQYSDYISRRDTNEKIDRENAKYMKLAQQMVAQTGQPKEAVYSVYQSLQAGQDQGELMKQLQNNQANFTPSNVSGTGAPGAPSDTSGPADPRDGLTSGAQNAVSAQMQQSGMTPPPEGGIFGNIQASLHDTMGGLSQGKAARDSQRAQEQVAGAAGVSPDQVKQTMAPRQAQGNPGAIGENLPGADGTISWTPKSNIRFDASKVNNLGDAIAYDQWAKTHGTAAEIADAGALLDRYQHNQATQAALTAQANGTGFTYARGFIKDQNGGWSGGVAIPTSDGKGGYVWKDIHGNALDQSQVMPVDKEMESDIKGVSTEMAKPLQDYSVAKQDTKQLIRLSSDISKMAKEHPEAMGTSGNISQMTDSLKRAGINVAKIINPNFDPEKQGDQVDPGVFGELEKSEKAVNGMLKGVTDRNAKNAYYATLMDIQATRLAYMWAKDQGQSGRSVSNQDFKNFKDVAMGGGNPAALQKSASDFLAQKIKSVKDQENGISQGGGAGTYFSQKYPGVPNPFKITSTMDDEIKSDPELQQAMDYVNSGNGPDDGTQVNTTDSDIPDLVRQNKAVDFGGQPISPDAWKYLPKEVQDALKKKNGIQ